MNIVGNDSIISAQGNGTSESPYIYNWTPSNTATSVTQDQQLGTIYNVTFNFVDKSTSKQVGTYTIRYVQYSDTTKQESDKSSIQKMFESRYAEKTKSMTKAKHTFYPLTGTTFRVFLMNSSGQYQAFDINIPPIPPEYLFIDQGTNLDYNELTDSFAINPSKPYYRNVSTTDLLEITVEHLVFANNLLSSSIHIELRLSTGESVLYNPIMSGGATRKSDQLSEKVQPILLPILIDSSSKDYATYSPLLQAGNTLSALVYEKGDVNLSGFHKENLKISHRDGNVITFEVKHLSAFGMDITIQEESTTTSTPTTIVQGSNDSGNGSCFIESCGSIGVFGGFGLFGLFGICGFLWTLRDYILTTVIN
jgi:hypothetical protein